MLKKENPSYPFVFDFVDEKVNMFYKAEILVSRLSGVFATLAIIISCLGLFGLAAYTAERRAREMSIRKVLGAGVVNISRLMVSGFLYPIALAAAIAFPLGWWIMKNWLEDFPYRTHLSIWLFILAGSIVLLIALCTIGVQSLRTAIQNPVQKLRAE